MTEQSKINFFFVILRLNAVFIENLYGVGAVGWRSPAFAGRQERASVRPCADGALLRLELLVLLVQAKRTTRKKKMIN
ncbi:hypothetical protein [Algoriphagus marincola]|uniref:hypothetical protein n=1 Tax=Algoriphagus marincola TaxID=264027 RepID=UPI0003FCA79C|nr:hypothetical protein [Algoriphagus marincola]